MLVMDVSSGRTQRVAIPFVVYSGPLLVKLFRSMAMG